MRPLRIATIAREQRQRDRRADRHGGGGVVEFERTHADHDEHADRRDDRDRLERAAALGAPVDVLHARPQRELVQREAGADAEHRGDEPVPRLAEVEPESEEAGAEHQEDAPDEVVQVHSAGGLDTPGPPREGPGHAGARADREEREQHRREDHERVLAAVVGHDQVVDVADREDARHRFTHRPPPAAG